MRVVTRQYRTLWWCLRRHSEWAALPVLGRTPRAPLFLRVGGLVFGFGNDGLDFLARRSTGGIGFVTHHRVGAGPRPALSCAREGDGVNDMGNICEVEPWPGPIMKALGLYFPSLSWWIFVLSPPQERPTAWS